MSWFKNKFFYKDGTIAKCLLCFRSVIYFQFSLKFLFMIFIIHIPCPFKLLGHFVHLHYNSHSTASATKGGFEHDWNAMRLAESNSFLKVITYLITSRFNFKRTTIHYLSCIDCSLSSRDNWQASTCGSMSVNWYLKLWKWYQTQRLKSQRQPAPFWKSDLQIRSKCLVKHLNRFWINFAHLAASLSPIRAITDEEGPINSMPAFSQAFITFIFISSKINVFFKRKG